MNDLLVILPVALWLLTTGLLCFFLRIVKNKTKNHKELYLQFRFPHFFASLLNSIVSVTFLLLLQNDALSTQWVTYIGAPYIGIFAYDVTSAFRIIKEIRF